VAQALGHESETTSRESYIAREAITGADQNFTTAEPRVRKKENRGDERIEPSAS
jgi:hypothetical protein